MKSFMSRWLPVLAWAVLILLASSIPRPLEIYPSGIISPLRELRILGIEGITLASFLIHFLLYGVLGFLAGCALAGSGPFTIHLFLVGLALCTLFGLLDELYQISIPGRDFEWVDVLANGLGSAAGLGVFNIRNQIKGD
jgi:hypothetical protein